MDDQFLQQVKELSEQGLSQRVIADRLGVKRNRVQTALKKLQQPEDSKALVPVDQVRAIIQEEFRKAREEDKENEGRFPMIRKWGGGMETAASEAILEEYMGQTPEEQVELKAIMKFRAAMLMVMDLVNIQKGNAEADAERMMPILRLMKETREEQDAAAARAKSSSEDIADRAAHETAGQLLGALSQNNAQVNGSLEQIRQMLSGKSDDPFSRLLNMMQSMQQMSQMFGMPMPGMMPGATGNQSGFQPPAEPHPIEKHSISELEE